MELLTALNKRFVSKKMNGTPVAEHLVNDIIEAARLAPTSSGVQPFKVIVITNPELKAKIQPIAFNQTQIVEGSHILLFASWDKYTDERLTEIFNLTNTERGLPLDITDAYKAQLLGMFGAMTEEQQYAHAAHQSYIALGTAIVAAAMYNVDATPMEGFNNAALDELLNLKALGLKSTTMLVLGHSDEQQDWMRNLKKVRRPLADFVIEMK